MASTLLFSAIVSLILKRNETVKFLQTSASARQLAESCPRLISALAALHKLYRFSSMETLGPPRTTSALERGTMCNYLQAKLKCSKRYPFNLTGSDTRAKLRSKVNVKYTSI